MAQRVATLPAANLVGEGVAAILGLVLDLLRQTVRMDWIFECRPRCVVFVFLCASQENLLILVFLKVCKPGKQWVITLTADIHPRAEVVPVDLLFSPRTERHSD